VVGIGKVQNKPVSGVSGYNKFPGVGIEEVAFTGPKTEYSDKFTLNDQGKATFSRQGGGLK
jgi:hypothetical protein